MRLGPFYFDRKELLLLVATMLLGASLYFTWDVILFERQALLTIGIIILITKGLLPGIHNSPFFILALIALLFTAFMPAFQIFLFYAVSFILFRLFRVI